MLWMMRTHVISQATWVAAHQCTHWTRPWTISHVVLRMYALAPHPIAARCITSNHQEDLCTIGDAVLAKCGVIKQLRLCVTAEGQVHLLPVSRRATHALQPRRQLSNGA